jgi:hypothetical protein
MWSYATCGMCCQPDAVALELHLFSPVETESHVELLTSVAHYHLTGAYLDLGHVVNFGRPWLPNSLCGHGLVSLPYLDGSRLEWLSSRVGTVRFLWLLPITSQEAKFCSENGLEFLERKFESESFDYLNPLRSSVI